MGPVKTVAIAFIIAFAVIGFITIPKVRIGTFKLFNHKIGKSNIKIYNLVVVLIVIILILYSSKILYRLRILESLRQRRLEVSQSYEEK